MALLLLALFTSLTAADDNAPQIRFRLSPEHVSSDQLRAERGELQGVVVGGAEWTTEKPTALRFDGKRHVTLADDHTTAKLPPKTLSIAAWVRLDASQEWGGLVSCIQDDGDDERGWLLGFRGTKFCFALASEKTKKLTYLTAPVGASQGEWYHVVATYDGARMTLYVDGRPVAISSEQQGDILYPQKTWLELGAYRDANELYAMVGQMAEASWYDRAISANEVSDLFQSRTKDFPGSLPSSLATPGWPTYQHDYDRTGVAGEALALPLAPAWIYYARHAPAAAWPPPAQQDFWHKISNIKARVVYDRAMHTVSDGERLYFGSSADDAVRCLDLATGRELWKFLAEGPMRLAPTVYEERVYFGSDDGCAYCLSAADGKLLWQTRIAPSDRRLPGNERMISAWPVRTDLFVAKGQVRCAAGLFPSEGAYHVALDAKTGEILAREEITFSPQGYLRHDGQQLMVAQGRSPEAPLMKLPRSGKLITTALAQIDETYPLARVGTATHTFAGGSGKIAAFDNTTGERVWTTEVDGDAWGLAIAGGKLIVSTDRGRIYAFATSDDATAKATELQPPAAELPPDNTPAATLAKEVLQQYAADQGWCLVLGAASDAALAVELARQSRLQIVCVEPDAEVGSQARSAIAAAGFAPRVTVHHLALKQLPYVQRLFNVAVADPTLLTGETWPIDLAEMRELVRPAGGVAIVAVPEVDDAAVREKQVNLLATALSSDNRGAWRTATDGRLATYVRPALAGAGEWTHMYASPANTSASGDTYVRGELGVQWFGRPGPQEMIDRHHRTVPPLWKNGRLFVPGNNRMICVDAYNGTNYWNVEVPGSRRVGAMRDCGSMAAAGDAVYVAAGDTCFALDVATGETSKRFVVPPMKSDGGVDTEDTARDWGYVAVVNDSLFGSRTRRGAARSGHSLPQINETYFDHIPLVTGDALFHVDRRSGELRWKNEAKHGAIINSTITIADGRVFYIASKDPATLDVTNGRVRLHDLAAKGAELVAIDAASGDPLWRQDVDFSKLQHSLYLCWSDGVLIASGARNHRADEKQPLTVWYDTYAYSASDGKPLWNVTQNNRRGTGGDHGEQDQHPVIVGNRVYIEPLAYDLRTGKQVEGWNLVRGGHGCGAISASANACFFRASNPAMADLETGKVSKVTTVTRPGCWISLIPAGGMLLAPEASSGCTCNYPVQTSIGLAPRSSP
jgi:outer membrane protein assembly factor BamB